MAAAPATGAGPDVTADRSLTILTTRDAENYRRIFALQEDAKWAAADRLIKQLDDPILMGYVLFQRYMHPTGYRSRYAELAPWLTKYNDLPGARRIYRLASKRRPKGVRSPKRPLAAAVRIATNAAPAAAPPTSRLKRREVATLKSRINRYLRRSNADRAEKRLWASARAGVLSDVGFDIQLGRVAAAYYYLGDDDKALALASLAARSRADAPTVDWIAGLAAWRLGRWDQAATHFAALARARGPSEWIISAAAFWGARAYLVSHEPQRVNPLLAIAARHSHTFYGQLAARQLGKKIAYSWDKPPLLPEDMLKLNGLAGALRVMALVQTGQTHWADQDLKLTARRATPGLFAALLGLASRLNLPSTQLTLSDLMTAVAGPVLDSVRYPLPDWEPEGGFSVDKAVMFAVIRQESRFNNRAKSPVGARGLMQLMPRTASFIGRDRTLRHVNKTKLFAPDFNMALGQLYLKHLTEIDYIGDNVFLIVGAYNGGPGNISRWLKNSRHGDDWLLFIESIPNAETRDFIEKVVANLWIYRAHLGQPAPTLDAVAAGGWPVYTAIDGAPGKAADASGAEEKPWPESMNLSLFSPSISP